MATPGYPASFPFEGRMPSEAPFELIHPPTEIPDGVYASSDPEFGDAIGEVAQALHTEKYLRVSYIKPEDLDENGLYTDYAGRSTYYYTKVAERAATVRQIGCDKKEGISSLPTLHNFAIDPEALKGAAGVDKLVDIKPRETVEISALASNGPNGITDADLNTVHLLYARMLRDSLENGHKYWVLNTYPALAKRLKLLIGEDQLHTIGESREYMGSETTPYLIKPQEVVRRLLGSDDSRFDYHKAYLREVFAGIQDHKIPKDIKELFETNEIDSVSAAWLKRLVTNKHFLIGSFLAAYCSARALPVGGIDEFEGSAAVFWGIDIGTAYPYAHGLYTMHTAKSLGGRALGATEATGSFAAPYVYLYMEGNDYPPYVHAAIGAFAAYTVAKETISSRRRRLGERRLEENLRTTSD